jgi:hypothetical protein
MNFWVSRKIGSFSRRGPILICLCLSLPRLVLPQQGSEPPQVRTGIYRGRSVTYIVKNGLNIYEGDIVLDPQGFSSPGRVSNQSISIAYTNFLWPKVGSVYQVPVVITSDPAGAFCGAATIATCVSTSAAKIFNNTFPGLIQLVDRTSETSYVNVNLSGTDNSGVCFSTVGKAPIGFQPQGIGGSGGSTFHCTPPTLVHELGHTVGLWHVQSRADRDSYVTINFANIIKSLQSNFDQVFDNGQDSGLYDYGSLMHYFGTAFSSNGLVTIESKPAGIPLSNQTGYTADDIDGIKRLYFTAPTQVTVTSNPPGLTVTVDGTNVTTPHVFSWTMGSMHSLSVPETCGGPPCPQSVGGFNYIYGIWSDRLAETHNVTVSPGNGFGITPMSSPAITVYAAHFIQLLPYSKNTFGSGSFTQSPTPLTPTGLGGSTFYPARTLATFTATANSGNYFYNWFGSFSGGQATNPKTMVLDPFFTNIANPLQAVFSTTSDVVSTVSSNPAGLSVSVGGTGINAPRTFSSSQDSGWGSGTSHSVQVTTTTQQPFSAGTRYVFNNWSDAGANPHNITAPASVTANFTTQYAVTTVINPTCGGSIGLNPSATGNFYTAGTPVQMTATANSGWTFAGWQKDLTGATNPQTPTVNSEMLVQANFNTVSTPLTVTSLSPNNAGVGYSGSPFNVTITGTGFDATNSLVFVNNSFRSSTFNNSTSLTIQISSSDLSGNGVGGFQVGVQNAPSGATCGAFAALPFFVTNSATAAAIQSFNAFRTPGGVALEWKTGFEAENLGFRVYRETGGQRVRLTPQLLAGSALRAGSKTIQRSGNSYFWLDDSAGSTNSSYWLEELDIHGKVTWHGPILPGQTPISRKPAAIPLGRLGGAAKPVAAVGSRPVRVTARLAPATDAERRAQAQISSGTAVKISVREEGWYRITRAELLAAGLDPNADPALWQLWVEGHEQPAHVQDGNLEFYGLGLDTAASDTRVYWLVAGTQPGQRIRTVAAGDGRPAPRSFPFTVERKDRTVYFSALLNGDKENFFGDAVVKDPTVEPLTVTHLDPAAEAEPATVEVALQGVTTGAHAVKILLNGSEIGKLAFADLTEGIAHLNAAHSLLKEGFNSVTLVPQGGDEDVTLVDYVRLTYLHTLVSDSNTLRLSAAGGQSVTLDGFTAAGVRVVDITDPGNVVELGTAVRQANTGYRVETTAPAGDLRTLLAFTDDQAKHPAAMARNYPSTWRTPDHAADLLIIACREFFDNLQPLQALRQGQGLAVEMADVEDIFAEFSFGEKTPQAIRDFLAYAKANWQAAPRYILLAGKASYDPKNYLGNGDFDLVPTRLVDTQRMETASDDWFADFDDSGLPQMALGRLPFRNAQEADAMIGSILHYEQTTASGGVLLVSDEGANFNDLSHWIKTGLPTGLNVQEINRNILDPDTARGNFLAAMSSGQRVVNYLGHGSVDLWRGDLLTNDDVPNLGNPDRPSFFAMMTCLNGYFQDPALDSLAESLIKSGNGGIVAAWASTGMTETQDQAPLDGGMLGAIFGGPPQLLGDLTVLAKQSAVNQDVRRTWILFGDPSMTLR